MKKRVALCLMLLCPVLTWAVPEAAAQRSVNLWNRDQDRIAHYPQVFSESLVQRRTAVGLERILAMLSSDNSDIAIHQV